MPGAPLTKGVGFINARAFVLSRWGPGGWEAVQERLRPSDRDELAAVVPVGWYPLALYARLLHAIDEVHGAGDLALVVQLGRFEAEHDITTLYRLMFRLVSPATLVEKTGTYWKKFHDTGEWEMTRVGDHEIHAVLKGWGVVDHALCRELVGYLSRVMELVGAEAVVLEHSECRARGAERCFFRGRWGATSTNAVDSTRR